METFKVKTQRLSILGAILLGASLPWAAFGQAATERATEATAIRIDGSTTVFPLIEDLVARFVAVKPGTEIRLASSSSGRGIAGLLDGSVDVALASRPITREEDQALLAAGAPYLEVPIARDAIAVVVNPQNQWLELLSVDELHEIWCRGGLRSWDQVRPEGPAIPLLKEAPREDAGTVGAFLDTLGGEALDPSVRRHETPASVVDAVARERGAIGIVSLQDVLAEPRRVRAIPIDEGFGAPAVEPSLSTLYDGTYPLGRPLWLYLREATCGRPEVSALVAFMLEEVTERAGEHGLAALGAPIMDGARRRFEDRVTGSVMLAGDLSALIEGYLYFATTSVTATGNVLDTFKVASPVIVVDAERIEELMPDNAADLLRGEAGVDVTGVGPNQARPIIRGQRGLRILFLENGLRMNNARRQTDFGEIPGLVDVGNVEVMEVVRGPASVLYGSDAIGGVINLITKRPSSQGDQLGLSLRLRYSTVDEQEKGALDLSGHSGNFSYRLGYTGRAAQDYKAPAGRFGDIVLDDETTVVDTGLDDDSVHLHLAYRLNDRHSVFLRANRYRAGETGYGFVEPTLVDKDANVRTRIYYPFQDFDRVTLGYDASGLEAGFADTVEFQAYQQANQRQLRNDISIDIGPIFGPGPHSEVHFESLNFTDLNTYGFRAELTKILGDDHLLIYGAELVHDDSFNTDAATTTTTLRAYFPVCGDFVFLPPVFECASVSTDDVANAPNATNRSYGLFVQDSWVATGKLTATYGLRYANTETRAKVTPGWNTSGLAFEDDAVVGSLHLTYGITPDLNLVGSYATAFRAPNIIEWLFRGVTPEGTGFQVLNPGLRSERSDNFDFGFKLRKPRAFLEAAYFHTEVDDAILQRRLTASEIAELTPELRQEIEDSGASVVIQQRNADRLKIEGLEVSGGYRFENGFSLGGNYTHLSGESSSGGDPTGDTFSNKLNAYLRYEAKEGRYWLEYSLRRNGEEDLDLDSTEAPGPLGEVLPAFTIHRLAGGFTLAERDRHSHRLGLLLDNLTDEVYAEFSNALFFRPQPGRNVVLTYVLRLR